MKSPVFTIEEAAEYLKVHSQTVYKMVREGQIKAAKVGREWRIHKEALDNYLLGEKLKATKPIPIPKDEYPF